MKLALILLTVCAALAQEAPRESKTNEESNRKEGQQEGTSEFEVEFVASDVFRSGSYVQPIWRGLAFEGHHFGGKTTDVEFTGVSYTFQPRRVKALAGRGGGVRQQPVRHDPDLQLPMGLRPRLVRNARSLPAGISQDTRIQGGGGRELRSATRTSLLCPTHDFRRRSCQCPMEARDGRGHLGIHSFPRRR